MTRDPVDGLVRLRARQEGAAQQSLRQRQDELGHAEQRLQALHERSLADAAASLAESLTLELATARGLIEEKVLAQQILALQQHAGRARAELIERRSDRLVAEHVQQRHRLASHRRQERSLQRAVDERSARGRSG